MFDCSRRLSLNHRGGISLARAIRTALRGIDGANGCMQETRDGQYASTHEQKRRCPSEHSELLSACTERRLPPRTVKLMQYHRMTIVRHLCCASQLGWPRSFPQGDIGDTNSTVRTQLP